MPDGGTLAPAAPDLRKLTRAQTVEVLGYVESTIAHVIRYTRDTLRANPRANCLLAPEDLRSIGQMEALLAATRFDPTTGASLKTWVRLRARYAMLDEVRRVTANAHTEMVVTWRGDPRHLVAPPDEALCVELSNDGEPTPEELVIERQALSVVAANVHRLAPREQIVVSKRLAGADENGAELAESFGINRSRVCRAYASAVKKLNKELKLNVALGPGPRGVAVCG